MPEEMTINLIRRVDVIRFEWKFLPLDLRSLRSNIVYDVFISSMKTPDSAHIHLKKKTVERTQTLQVIARRTNTFSERSRFKQTKLQVFN